MTVTYPFQGQRVELIPQEGGFQVLQPGQYGRWADGSWYGETPNGHGCNLTAHKITEHADGTITVSPSIKVTGSKGVELWHGWLQNGVWKL